MNGYTRGESISGDLIKFGALMILMVLEALVTGFTLWVLWGWFAVPLFDVAINLVQAIGIMVLLQFVVGKYKEVDTDNIKWLDLTVGIFVRPGMYLAIGWLIHFITA